MKTNESFRHLTPIWRYTQRFALLAAVLMLLTGLLRGEARMVLQRAIQICLGCIGIG